MRDSSILPDSSSSIRSEVCGEVCAVALLVEAYVVDALGGVEVGLHQRGYVGRRVVVVEQVDVAVHVCYEQVPQPGIVLHAADHVVRQVVALGVRCHLARLLVVGEEERLLHGVFRGGGALRLPCRHDVSLGRRVNYRYGVGVECGVELPVAAQLGMSRAAYRRCRQCCGYESVGHSVVFSLSGVSCRGMPRYRSSCRVARPRWEIAFFSSALISANEMPVSSGMNTGS